MKDTIYIFSNGTLKRKDNTIFFETAEGKKKYIPVENTKEIFVFGEFTLNNKLLDFLTKKEIVLHYFNYYDYYSGTFYPREHYNSGYMILKQAIAYNDFSKRLYLAISFVVGAIENSIKILQYYNRRGGDLEEEISNLLEILTKVKKVSRIEKLMELEGRAKSIYYNSFNKIINSEEFRFVNRTRRPAKDFLNALISFSNSVIYSYVLSEIYQTHLDPRIGFLHTTNFRSFSLNLDIAEIFKVVIGDRLILSLINKGIIKPKDFDKLLNGTFLNDKGKQKFLQKMEEKLKQTIKHKKLNRKVSYRLLIRLELYKLEKYLLGEEDYNPFIMEW